MAKLELTPATFESGTFPHMVLSLRETCLAGAATPEQATDWRHLADWLGCGDGPVTRADIDRLIEARLGFLRRANGSPFDAAKLPPSDICDIFERLSPAAAAIDKMVVQKQKRDATVPPARGMDRMAGIVISGTIGLAVISVFCVLPQGNLSPEALGYAIGRATVPVLIAGLITKLIKGGAVFRPLTDGAIFAALVGGLMVLAAQGSASSEGAQAASVATVGAVISAVGTFILTAMVTGIITLLAPKPKPSHVRRSEWF